MLCNDLCNEGTLFGCQSPTNDASCTDWLNDYKYDPKHGGMVNTEDTDPTTCADIFTLPDNTTAPFCSKIFCYNLFDQGQMDAYESIFRDESGNICSDPRAQVVPLLYGFYICVLSPFILLFFQYVLGSRNEDMLWQEIPEHRWLWEMDYQVSCAQTMIDRLDKTVKKYGSCRAVGNKNSGTVKGPWSYLSYRDYMDEILSLGRFLIEMGMERAAPVCILSFNRPEWFIADLATMYAGGVPAGIYPTDTSSGVKYIVNHSECQIVVVENQRQLEKLRVIKNQLLHVKEIIVMEDKDTAVSLDKLGLRATAAEEAKMRDAAEQEASSGDNAVIEEESDWAENFEVSELSGKKILTQQNATTYNCAGSRSLLERYQEEVLCEEGRRQEEGLGNRPHRVHERRCNQETGRTSAAAEERGSARRRHLYDLYLRDDGCPKMRHDHPP